MTVNSRRIQDFVFRLMRQADLTDTLCSSLNSLAGSSTDRLFLYGDEVCDISEVERLRYAFVTHHLPRRQLLIKLCSLCKSDSSPTLQHKWHNIVIDVVSIQGVRYPVQVGLELLFSLRHVISASSTNSGARSLAVDCVRHLLIRGHLIVHLVRAGQGAFSDEDITDACTVVAGLPSVVANAMFGTPPADFEITNYLRSLLRDLVHGVEALGASRTFAGRLLGRLCYSGHGAIVWRLLLPLCVSSDSSEVAARLQSVLAQVDTAHLSATLTPLFRLAPNWRLLVVLLVSADEKQQRRCPDIESAVFLTLMGHHYLPGIGGVTDDGYGGLRVICNTVGFTAAYNTDFLLELFQALLSAWSASYAIVGPTASHQQHLYCSQALLATVRHVSLSGLMPDITELVLPAITRHLSSTAEETRLIGMVVGEALVHHFHVGVEGDNGTRLKFEYKETSESAALKSMLEEEIVVATEKEEVVDGLSLDLEEEEEEEEKKRNASPLDSDDDEEEEEKDFMPMDMSHDLPLIQGRSPKYVRECLAGLRGTSPEEMDTLIACVDAAERLIVDHPTAAREVAVDFGHAVIHLAPDCHIDDLTRKRVAILVALTEVAPVPMAQFLTNCFYAPNYSIAHRLDVLAAIADSAQRLSAPPTATKRDLTPIDSAGSGWRAEIEARVAAKTRRFASARRQVPTSPSRFAPVAGHFFFPLLGAFDRPMGVLDLLQRDHLVLARLLLTLACIVSCAEHSPALPNIARALLDFVATLRGHPDPSVRRGLLFACAALAGACPVYLLLPDLAKELTETRVWLEHSRSDDPDADCRQLAVWTSSIVNARFRDFISVSPT